MKQEILRSPFLTHYFTEENNFLEQIWTNNEDIDEKDFKNSMLEYVELYKTYDIKFVLVDSRFIAYAVTADVQDWVNENILPTVMQNIDKLCFVLSDNFFEEMSIRQAIDDSNAGPDNVKYFKDEEEAKIWLLG